MHSESDCAVELPQARHGKHKSLVITHMFRAPCVRIVLYAISRNHSRFDILPSLGFLHHRTVVGVGASVYSKPYLFIFRVTLFNRHHNIQVNPSMFLIKETVT